MKRTLINLKALLLGVLVINLALAASAGPVKFGSANLNADWRLCFADETTVADATGRTDVSSWLKAVVPGAVFTSFVEAGLEPDPNFGDNAWKVDKKKYARDVWYRTTVPSDAFPEGLRKWILFEGVNRRGEVFFNGVRLGELDGFMDRGAYDVTTLLNDDSPNVLAVLVHIPTKPIANLASPTYISSDGWDWMPPVPGLLGGITDDVFLSASGDVTLTDPWIRTKVPSQDEASVSLSVTLENHGTETREALVKFVLNPGKIMVERMVLVRPGLPTSCNFLPEILPQLVLRNPSLWWPNGYGDQPLYTCELTCEVDGAVSDSKTVKFGIKEYSYDFAKGVFQISCNGEKIYCKGGNWGMSEWLLRCREDEYDLKVKLHKEMNFNMIRNWIGSTTDDEFYEACDKYGIMVFDDFWLNSHPNLPTDVFAFNRNAVEKIKRLRNHPSIALWCGDNEGVPRPPLNEWLREDVKVYDGGDRWYQPISREFGFSGSGPWTNSHPIWYFTPIPSGFGDNKLDGWGFRSEIGTAVFTNYESLRKFIPDADVWPLDSLMLERHYFGWSSFNSRPDRYFATVEYNYGKASGTEDFCIKAQLLNYEVNRAMYEGWQHHLWNDASGLLTWMGQSAYPSLVWQTYDYYYDLNGAYWGVKKGCEPVHVQWSYADNSVKAVNTTNQSYDDVRVDARVYNMDGKEVRKFARSIQGRCPANKANYLFSLDLPGDDNIARGCEAKGSSSGVTDYHNPSAVTDGNTGSAWSARPGGPQWVSVDLGKTRTFRRIVLTWESRACEDYDILVSDDGENWRSAYSSGKASGSVDEIEIDPVIARYVKVEGKAYPRRGMALHEIEIYENPVPDKGELDPVHFIRLQMRDASGRLLSENFYWRSLRLGDYKALSSLPSSNLVVKTKESRLDGSRHIRAEITNKGKGVAFGIRVIPVMASTGDQIVPALMDENYFSLLPGESKVVSVQFDENLLNGDACRIEARPYNR